MRCKPGRMLFCCCRCRSQAKALAHHRRRMALGGALSFYCGPIALPAFSLSSTEPALPAFALSSTEPALPAFALSSTEPALQAFALSSTEPALPARSRQQAPSWSGHAGSLKSDQVRLADARPTKATRTELKCPRRFPQVRPSQTCRRAADQGNKHRAEVSALVPSSQTKSDLPTRGRPRQQAPS